MSIMSIILTLSLWVVCSYSACKLVDYGIVNIGYKDMTNKEKGTIINIGGPLILMIGVGVGLLYLLSTAVFLVMHMTSR